MPDSPPPSDRPDFTKDKDGVPSYNRGKWWPAYALLVLPFIFVFIPLYRAARKDVNWRAAFAVLFVFEALMLVCEHVSVMRGHWVWNEARILGPKVFGIPIEEPLIYYSFPPIFTVVLFFAVRRCLEKRRRP